MSFPARVLTPEEEDLALDLVYNGHPLKDIHAALNMSAFTFAAIRRKHTVFAQALAVAQEEACHMLADRALTVVDEYLDPQRARIMFDAIRWITGKRMPRVYGERLDLNVNQTIDIGSALSEAMGRALPNSESAEFRVIESNTVDAVNPTNSFSGDVRTPHGVEIISPAGRQAAEIPSPATGHQPPAVRALDKRLPRMRPLRPIPLEEKEIDRGRWRAGDNDEISSEDIFT